MKKIENDPNLLRLSPCHDAPQCGQLDTVMCLIHNTFYDRSRSMSRQSLIFFHFLF